MKKLYRQCAAAMVLLMAFLLIMSGARRKEEALAARIAPEVLRFHVLANSDSQKDQELKLLLKDYLLDLIRPHATSKENTQNYIIQNRDALEEAADSFLSSLGSDQTARICLETCAFPRRIYGDIVFPAGTYDAVRVLIGEGAGKNFWCVLYPSLCYLQSSYAVTSPETENEHSPLLPEEDLYAVLAVRNNKKTEQEISLPRIVFRMKLLEWFPF